jgi:hypothetical protein
VAVPRPEGAGSTAAGGSKRASRLDAGCGTGGMLASLAVAANAKPAGAVGRSAGRRRPQERHGRGGGQRQRSAVRRRALSALAGKAADGYEGKAPNHHRHSRQAAALFVSSTSARLPIFATLLKALSGKIFEFFLSSIASDRLT